MTEKELQKLKRHEVLGLLLLQVKEADELREQLTVTEDRLQTAEQTVERLKSRLNEKDEQLERLKERLNEKDVQINRLKARLDQKDEKIAQLTAEIEGYWQDALDHSEREGSIAEAALRLSGIFEAAQKAVNAYTEAVRRRQEKGPEEEK